MSMFTARNNLSALFALLLLTFLAACGGDVNSDCGIEIDNARSEISAGNIKEATDICNRLLADSASLNAEMLLNLAVTYMEIADKSDHSDPTDMISSAIDCYKQAIVKDSVATATSVGNLQSTEYVYAMILNNLTQALDANDSIVPDDFEFNAIDSIF